MCDLQKYMEAPGAPGACSGSEEVDYNKLSLSVIMLCVYWFSNVL